MQDALLAILQISQMFKETPFTNILLDSNPRSTLTTRRKDKASAILCIQMNR